MKDKHHVYTSAKVVAKSMNKYSDVAELIIKTRNLICHQMCTIRCEQYCHDLLRRWSDVADMLVYLNVLSIGEADILGFYYRKVGIESIPDKKEEYARLCALYNTTDINELSTHIKEDLL